MTGAPHLTQHAARRWSYRCVGLDLAHEWGRARRITVKRLARLQGRLGYRTTRWAKASYLLSPAGCVFVLAPNGNVMTVLRVMVR